MLRSLNLHKSIQKKIYNLNGVFGLRNYNYQTEIYTNKFENNEIYKELRKDLDKIAGLKNSQPNLFRFIKAYQEYGYKLANLDPLKQSANQALSELDPGYYGISRDSVKHSVEGLLNSKSTSMSVDEIESYLKGVYSSNMAIEFEHITNEEEKFWIAR